MSQEFSLVKEVYGPSINSLEHICIGISPLNGYYKVHRIEKLAQWAFDNFSKVHFFIPDQQLEYNFRAYGDSDAKARKKAKRKGNYANNLVIRALTNLGLGYSESREKILNWEKLSQNPQYNARHQEIIDLFNSNSYFKNESISTSVDCMAHERVGSVGVRRELLYPEEAVKYFLTEIPLFVYTPEILGVESSAFAYHKDLPFVDKLFSDKFSITPAQGQGYILLNELD